MIKFKFKFKLLLVVAAVWLCTPIAAQQAQRPYRILVSNDDGVRAPGIAAVALALQAVGEVQIIAPSSEQSGKGHSIVTSEPIFREDLTLPNGLRAIGLSATPASTVNVAIRNILMPAPDLVVSGINRGYNLGYSVYLSGTAGAARQGVMLGVPAIAASLAQAATPRDYDVAAREVVRIAARVKANRLPPGTFLNINIPPLPQGGYRGIEVTTQAMLEGGNESFAEMKHPSGRTIYWNVYAEGRTAPQGTDIWAVENGYVSVTPMKLGETDGAQMNAVRAWLK